MFDSYSCIHLSIEAIVLYHVISFTFFKIQEISGLVVPPPKHIQKNMYSIGEINLFTIVILLDSYLLSCHQSKSDYNISYLSRFYTIFQAGIIASAWFFVMHWLFHQNKFIYKQFHSQHHGWVLTDARATLYSHAVENICCNFMSIWLPIYILSMSFTSVRIWVILAMTNSIFGHSGDIFNMVNSHNLHHRFITCNYGPGSIFDYMFGTTFEQNKPKYKKLY